MGQDLNTLGIDFDSADPLFPTFSTPFADANARPAIPEFRIPAAYTVSNVPPLHSRIGNFSDETLFAIFYQFTRDVLQEMAAAELYSRDWRWHKELRQWMMKDASMAQPLRITERSERGVYVFFDAMNWRRERVGLPPPPSVMNITLILICRENSSSTTTTSTNAMHRVSPPPRRRIADSMTFCVFRSRIGIWRCPYCVAGDEIRETSPSAIVSSKTRYFPSR